MCSHISASNKLVVGGLVAVGTVTAGLIYLYRKRKANLPPSKWKYVGKITEINCYPIKSCASVACESIECNVLCMENGNLRDRVFMIITLESQFVTGRAHPKIVLIKPTIVDNRMILSAPDKPDIELNFDDLKNKTSLKASVWDQEADTIDAGDKVAEWLSDYILGEKEGLRLVYYPHKKPTLPLNKFNSNKFDKVIKDDVGSLHDATGYMLINKASVDELNSHLDNPVKPLQFRPNFVVEGPTAYEEDNWKWIRIGNNVIFRNVKPCTRCVFTNIDPETGLRNPLRQPLETLKKNRTIITDEAPVLGIHLGLRSPGKVSVGDEVYVEDDQ